MGYRPSIKCKDIEIELGKFYGYVKIEGLESIKWLIDNNKVMEEEIDMFNYLSFGPSIKFNAEEFRQFFDLYEKDINNYDFDKDFICYPKDFKFFDNYPGLEEIYQNNNDKVIYWG